MIIRPYFHRKIKNLSTLTWIVPECDSEGQGMFYIVEDGDVEGKLFSSLDRVGKVNLGKEVLGNKERLGVGNSKT